jgi:hypothetical protein
MAATDLIRVAAVVAVATAAIALPSAAECPPDPPPPECDNNGQFVGGRWDLSQITGTYTISGSEVFYPYLDDPKLSDDYQVDGSLSVQMDGGSEENYLEVECDGTVTGQLKQRYTGTIDKTANISYYDPKYCIQEPSDMSWSITVERTVSVTGSVSGYGQLDLELSVDTASFELDGSLAQSFDCVFISGSGNVSSLDVSGDTESIRMSGGYDPDNGTFEPSITVTSSKPWIDDVLHRVTLDQDHQYQDDTITLSPSFSGGGSQAPLQEYNEYVLQDAVTVTGNEDATAEPKTPAITSMELQEPSQYLSDVNVDTRVEVEIEWYGQPPGQVEFTYGGTTETVSGGDTVTWDFDAGDSGTTIEAVAISGSERSEPYTINTPKVSIPGWAGSSSDWSGSSGVSYEATLDWPVSLETTKTLDTISLFTGLWGISGSASSEFNANANSNGSPGSGDMTTEADFEFAGQSATFSMEGPNQTTLSCDELTTNGSATATAQGPTWQKTINPLTAVPGLQSAACGLSGLLCGVVNSVGIKAQASATLSGTATYSDTGSDIQWDGGSIGGSITGRISAGANVPPPLSSVAGVEVYGSATGCIEFMVAPDLELTTVGGTLKAGASAWFMGQTTSVDEETPFGDGCGKAAPSKLLGPAVGWVPADGQLAMAAKGSGETLVGIAVWTETPAGQVRPSGDIWYRFFVDGAWGAPQQLTNDAASDVAPTVDFDSAGRALIVYQRSTAALPTNLGDLPAFANGYEIHWAAVDPVTALPMASGQLTSNAVHDLGPRLVRDTAGDLFLFWQRADGIEITGTAASPVSILVDSWKPTTVGWDGEITTASGLEHTFGWSPAAHSADTMLIGLIVDTDGDLTTAEDRELFRISRTGGSWALPIQVTTNLVADDAVLAAFDATGTPQLLWRREAAVQQLRSDLAATPVLAFASADPGLDDGIGSEFVAGRATGDAEGFSVLWVESLGAQLTGDDGAGWRLPRTAFASGDSEAVHFLRRIDGTLVAGYSVRSFVGDGSTLATLVEPRFVEVAGTAVFSDDFERGDYSAWTSVTQ